MPRGLHGITFTQVHKQGIDRSIYDIYIYIYAYIIRMYVYMYTYIYIYGTPPGPWFGVFDLVLCLFLASWTLCQN